MVPFSCFCSPAFSNSAIYQGHLIPGALYALRLKNAGIPVVWRHSKHGFHAMLNFHNELNMAHDAIVDMAAYIKDVVAKFNQTLSDPPAKDSASECLLLILSMHR